MPIFMLVRGQVPFVLCLSLHNFYLSRTIGHSSMSIYIIHLNVNTVNRVVEAVYVNYLPCVFYYPIYTNFTMKVLFKNRSF